MSRKVLIYAILVSGLVHLATLYLDNAAVHWVFKLLPMILIMLLAISSTSMDRSGVYKGLVVIGLVFSITGDAFLLNAGDRWFMFGLASFLVGHLCYIAAMFKRWRFSWPRLLLVVPIGIYSWLVGSVLHDSIVADDGQEAMWLPVLVYLIVIGTMCWLAFMSRNTHASIGATMFVISDSILAWNKFVGAVPAAGFLIMLTYFAAQLLIAGSIENVFTSRSMTKERGLRL